MCCIRNPTTSPAAALCARRPSTAGLCICSSLFCALIVPAENTRWCCMRQQANVWRAGRALNNKFPGDLKRVE